MSPQQDKLHRFFEKALERKAKQLRSKLTSLSASPLMRGYVYRVELPRVEAALARVHSGDYGRCLSCDEPISFERLRAIPEVLTCAACNTREQPSHWEMR